MASAPVKAYLADIRSAIKSVLGASVAVGPTVGAAADIVCTAPLPTASPAVLTLSAARIALGFLHEDPGDEFFKDIATSGPFMDIGRAALPQYDRHIPTVDTGTTHTPGYDVRVRLWTAFNREANADLLIQEALAEKIFQAWILNENWAGTGVMPPWTISWREPEVKPDLKPGIICYTYDMHFRSRYSTA